MVADRSRSVIAQVVQARRRQGRGLDRLQLQVDTRDLVIGPAERAQEKVVLGLREDNPFAAPGPDQSADGEAHEWTSSGAHSCLEWLSGWLSATRSASSTR